MLARLGLLKLNMVGIWETGLPAFPRPSQLWSFNAQLIAEPNRIRARRKCLINVPEANPHALIATAAPLIMGIQ